MDTLTSGQCLWLVLLVPHTVWGLPSTRSDSQCEHNFQVHQGHNIDLHLSNFTKTNMAKDVYCTVVVSADKGMRIVMDISFKRAPARAASGLRHLVPHVDCDTDYVHVGNDVRRVDVELMTSYKLCGHDNMRYEMTSRGNHMWLVYRASRRPEHFRVTVQARAPVACSTAQFQCSPVQCVAGSQVCDGVHDCSNGHDEFCHRVGVSSQDSVDEPCFRCGDGTCIRPRLSQYDLSYGRALWYLCDGFSHCPDAWDERKDICLQLQNGRVGSVTECVPFDLQFGHNGSVMMWNEVRCDDNIDCYYGDDESDCTRHAGSGQGNKLHADPLTIGIVTGVIVLLLAIAVPMILNFSRVATNARMSDTPFTQCTTVSQDDQMSMVAIGQEDAQSGCDVASRSPADSDKDEHTRTWLLTHTPG